MCALQAVALITLLPTAQGGLIEPMPLPSQSSLLRFTEMSSPQTIGVSIGKSGHGSALLPDTIDLTVQLRFWTSDARIIVALNSAFEIWYGRLIGNGIVVSVTEP